MSTKTEQAIKLSEIHPNKDNPRIIKDAKFDRLKKSIQEVSKFMELRPIIVDDDNMILGGNMRYRALKDLGYKEIPESWVKKANDLTDEEKKRFIIVDNVGFGDWDMDVINSDWDIDQLNEWGLDIPVWDVKKDIEEIENFNEECNFTIKCKDVAELEDLQTKLNCSGKKIGFNDFCIKAGL